MDYVSELLARLEESLELACEGLSEVGLVFSAGVDSALIGFLASKFVKVEGFNVGFEGSQDRVHAMDVGGELPFSVEYIQIDEGVVEKELSKIVSAVGEANPLKIAVAVPFYFASKVASEHGLSVMLCGQGADELFGGYNRYLRTVSDGGYGQLASELEADVDALWDAQLRFDVAIAHSNGVELRFPFLGDDFKAAALSVPVGLKIKKIEGEGEFACVDEVSGDSYVRKFVLRQMAKKAGVSKVILDRPKKAAQYGSGSEKLLKSIARKNGFSGRDALRVYVNSFF